MLQFPTAEHHSLIFSSAKHYLLQCSCNFLQDCRCFFVEQRQARGEREEPVTHFLFLFWIFGTAQFHFLALETWNSSKETIHPQEWKFDTNKMEKLNTRIDL